MLGQSQDFSEVETSQNNFASKSAYFKSKGPEREKTNYQIQDHEYILTRPKFHRTHSYVPEQPEMRRKHITFDVDECDTTKGATSPPNSSN